MADSRVAIRENIYRTTNVTGNATAIQGDNYGVININHGSAPVEIQKSERLLQSLLFDRWDARIRNVAAALDQTCQWIFDHEDFLKWLDPNRVNEHGNFLWLKGKPGSGKSTLMKTITKWAEKAYPSKCVVVSYFFNARSVYDLEKSSLGMYRALVHAVLVACPLVVETFTQMFSSKLGRNDTVDDWTVMELTDFLLECFSTSSMPPLILYIDALDEGSEDDMSAMVEFITDLVQRAHHAGNTVSVCISSRHYPGITAEPSRSIVVERQSAHHHDIETYIHKKLRGPYQSPSTDLRKTIASRANGVFLWVVLVIAILNSMFERGSSLQARSQKLLQVPTRLYDVFTAILSRDKEEIAQSYTLFRWILYSFSSLSQHELCGVVDLYEEDTALTSPDCHDHEGLDDHDLTARRLLHSSRGLVEMTKSQPPRVQFIHETVREYFLSPELVGHRMTTCEDGSQTFAAEQCHMSIAKECLKCLTTPLSGPEICPYQHALMRYAAKYWIQHLGEATLDPDQQVRALATDLLMHPSTLLRWRTMHDLDTESCISDFFESSAFHHDKIASPLYYAALTGLPWLVETVLKAGGKVNDISGMYGTALHAAAVKGDTKIIQILLGAGATPNMVAGIHYTAFRAAATEGHTEAVILLLDNGARDTIHENFHNPRSALHIAWSKGHMDVVRAIVNHRLTVFEPVETYLDIVKAAAQIHDCQLIRGVERIKPNLCSHLSPALRGAVLRATFIKDQSELLKRTLLSGSAENCEDIYVRILDQAIATGDTSLLNAVTWSGINVLSFRHRFNSVLYSAVTEDDAPVVSALLEAYSLSAESDAINTDCLRTALPRKRSEVIEPLLKLNVDSRLTWQECYEIIRASQISNDWTLPLLMVKHGKRIVQLALELGALLLLAANRDHVDVVKEILCGLLIDHRPRFSESLVRLVSSKSDSDLVQALLLVWPEKLKSSMLPLAFVTAVRHAQLQTVRLLVAHGVRVGDLQDQGASALAIVVDQKDEELVYYLLKVGAKPYVYATGVPNALYFAVKNGLVDVARVMLRADTDRRAYQEAMESAQQFGPMKSRLVALYVGLVHEKAEVERRVRAVQDNAVSQDLAQEDVEGYLDHTASANT